jgi:hypothetical protein
MTTVAQRAAVMSFDPAASFDKDPGRAFMSETDWNWHIRRALSYQTFSALHIREASETGVADLIVYHTVEFTSGPQSVNGPMQKIDAWLELKVVQLGEKWDGSIRAGQKQFMRDHWRIGRNALFVMFDRKVDMLSIRQGDLKGRVKMYKPNPYTLDWQEVFNHFKTRKVSL